MYEKLEKKKKSFEKRNKKKQTHTHGTNVTEKHPLPF